MKQVRRGERDAESAAELSSRLEGILHGVTFVGEATRGEGADLEAWESLVRGEYHEGFHRIALALLHKATSGTEVDKAALERSNQVRSTSSRGFSPMVWGPTSGLI